MEPTSLTSVRERSRSSARTTVVGAARRARDAIAAGWRLIEAFGFLGVLVTISPGLLAWMLHYDGAHDFVVSNNLSEADRHTALLWVTGGACAALAAYGASWMLGSRRGLTAKECICRTTDLGLGVVVVTLAVALLRSRLEERSGITLLVLVLACSVLACAFVYRALPHLPAHEALPLWRLLTARALPWVVLGLLVTWYAVFFSRLSVLDHRNFGTSIYDMAIYDNVLWRTTHGDFLGCAYCKGGKHYSAHFDPILLLVAPFYRAAPRAETLLVFQSVWLALGALPLYLLARRKLERPWLALTLPAIYLAYPALHGANMYDFHSLTLLAPLTLWAVYFLDSERVRPYFATLALLLLVREDVALSACLLGAYAVATGKPLTGAGTVAVALAYLAFTKLVIMPDAGLMMTAGSGGTSYADFYSGMIPHPEEGARGLLISLLTNPVFAAKSLLTSGKVFFFAALLVPLLLLPLFSGKKCLLMLYGFAFLGLASRPYIYQLNFQYSVTLFPALLAAAPDGALRVAQSRFARSLGLDAQRLITALLLASLGATALSGAKFGALAENRAFKAGWTTMQRAPSSEVIAQHEAIEKLLARIPPDAPVSATTWLAPHLSNRRDMYRYPRMEAARFIAVDRGDLDGKQRSAFDKLRAGVKFRELGAVGKVVVLERVRKP